MNKHAPTSKVAAGGGAGAIVTILVWVLAEFASVDIPSGVAAAAVLIIGTGAAYLKREVSGTDDPVA